MGIFVIPSHSHTIMEYVICLSFSFLGLRVCCGVLIVSFDPSGELLGLMPLLRGLYVCGGCVARVVARKGSWLWGLTR